MLDNERGALGKITEVLGDLRARWQDPSRQRQEYVTAGEVAAVNAEEQRQNPALLETLERLEAERHRLHALLVDGQMDGLGQVETLTAQVDRLRLDFAVLNV